MRKFLAFIAVTLIFLASFYLLLKKSYHVDEKLIESLVKPPTEDIAQLLPEGSDLAYPLIIPEGFRLAVFADLKQYGMPRVLAFDNNGVLFATLTGAGKLVALPDKDNSGIVDKVIVIKEGLNKPHGLVFHGEKLYLAETDKVLSYIYNPSDFSLSSREILFDLPGGGRHFTRTIKILGDKLYTSVGSSCDVCLESNEKRASLLVSDLDGGNLRVYASGLRNTVFFTFDNQGRIWGNDMGRDFLGDNLPPDELNIISAGGNYGWPYCYGKSVRDTKFRGLEALERCKNITKDTVYDYSAHVAPLGLTFINSALFSKDNQGDLLAAFHGSWNSSTPVGYKIVKLEIKDNKVINMTDFISGWLRDDGGVLGRPVDLVFDKNGVLYISDDKAGLIYILTKENN